MSITVPAGECPDCAGPLTAPPETDPWCGACEWNLDSFPVPDQAGWVWRRVHRWDSRAGFRADRHLARTTVDDVAPAWRLRLLLGVSAALMLALTAALVAAVWLIATASGPGAVVLGLLTLIPAWLLRPRFGRLKTLLAEGHRVSTPDAPALHALIGRIAAATGAPAPDVLVLDYEWNAAAATAGFRQTRVLLLGVPLLLALSPQDLVALIGHELGHFRHDTRSSWTRRPRRRSSASSARTPRRCSAPSPTSS